MVVDKLGDRLKNYITLNEAAAHTLMGHAFGAHAPGLKDSAIIGPLLKGSYPRA